MLGSRCGFLRPFTVDCSWSTQSTHGTWWYTACRCDNEYCAHPAWGLVYHCQACGVLLGVVVNLLYCWVAQKGIHLLLDVEWPAAAATSRVVQGSSMGQQLPSQHVTLACYCAIQQVAPTQLPCTDPPRSSFGTYLSATIPPRSLLAMYCN